MLSFALNHMHLKRQRLDKSQHCLYVLQYKKQSNTIQVYFRCHISDVFGIIKSHLKIKVCSVANIVYILMLMLRKTIIILRNITYRKCPMRFVLHFLHHSIKIIGGYSFCFYTNIFHGNVVMLIFICNVHLILKDIWSKNFCLFYSVFIELMKQIIAVIIQKRA